MFCSVPNTDWEEVLTVYRSNPTSTTVNNIPSILEKQQQEMSLHQQHMILNQIPNLHKWPWNNTSILNITHPQKFSISSRRYPGSPRNRILQAKRFREACDDIVIDCLQNVFENISVPVRYPDIKTIRRKRSLSEANQVDVENQVDVANQVVIANQVEVVNQVSF